VRNGPQIVQQAVYRQIRAAAQCRFFKVPRQVCQVRAPVDHRAGHVKTGRGRVATGPGQKRFDDRLESLEVAAGALRFPMSARCFTIAADEAGSEARKLLRFERGHAGLADELN